MLFSHCEYECGHQRKWKWSQVDRVSSYCEPASWRHVEKWLKPMMQRIDPVSSYREYDFGFHRKWKWSQVDMVSSYCEPASRRHVEKWLKPMTQRIDLVSSYHEYDFGYHRKWKWPELSSYSESAEGRHVEKCLKTNDDARSCRSNGLTAKKALAHALGRMLMILHDSCSPDECLVCSQFCWSHHLTNILDTLLGGNL